MKITTKVEVSLGSGAEVRLTESQEAQVSRFIESLILGDSKTAPVKTQNWGVGRIAGIKNWSKADIRTLKHEFKGIGGRSRYSVAERLAPVLGRSVKAVLLKANKVSKQKRAKKSWTPEEEEVLMKAVNSLTYESKSRLYRDVGKELGRTKASVANAYKRLVTSKQDSLPF